MSDLRTLTQLPDGAQVELINTGEEPFFWDHGGNVYVINPPVGVYRVVSKKIVVEHERKTGKKMRGRGRKQVAEVIEGQEKVKGRNFLRVPRDAALVALSAAGRKVHDGAVRLSERVAEEIGHEIRAEEAKLSEVRAEIARLEALKAEAEDEAQARVEKMRARAEAEQKERQAEAHAKAKAAQKK